jgi:hypothetical protein
VTNPAGAGLQSGTAALREFRERRKEKVDEWVLADGAGTKTLCLLLSCVSSAVTGSRETDASSRRDSHMSAEGKHALGNDASIDPFFAIELTVPEQESPADATGHAVIPASHGRLTRCERAMVMGGSPWGEPTYLTKAAGSFKL